MSSRSTTDAPSPAAPPPAGELGRTDEAAGDDALDRRRLRWSMAAAVLGFHLLTVGVLRWYYATHLPHYDSMGSYAMMARVSHRMRAGETAAAVEEAAGWHLSWLQSMFALAAGPYLPTSPAGYQLLNTMCVTIYLLSAYAFARQCGAGRRKSYLASLTVFLPDAFALWDGGLQDFKRESAMLLLMGATYFLLLAQFFNPTSMRGALLGLVAGLAVWSRGNAVGYMAVLFGPMVLVWVGIQVRRSMRFRSPRPAAQATGTPRPAAQATGILQPGAPATGILRTLAAPMVVFALVAGPNLYLTFKASVARYETPAVQSNLHHGAWASLSYYGWAPLSLWATREPNAGSTDLRFALALVQTAAFVAAAVVLLGRRLDLKALGSGRSSALIAGGAWAVVSTLLLICVYLGWHPGFGWAGMPPLYPTLLGPLSWLTAVILCLKERTGIPPLSPPANWGTDVSAPVNGGTDGRRLRRRWAAALTVGMGTLCLLGFRMYKKTQLPEPVAAAQELTRLLRKERPDPVMAFLSIDRLNLDTLHYVVAMSGDDLDRPFRAVEPIVLNGRVFHLGDRVPADLDIPAAQAAFLAKVRADADFVVINTDPAAYQRRTDAWNIFLFHHGAPIVLALSADAEFVRVFEYELDPGTHTHRRFAVLRNLRRAGSSR